jgi:hypothetical protein
MQYKKTKPKVTVTIESDGMDIDTKPKEKLKSNVSKFSNPKHKNKFNRKNKAKKV